MKKILFLIVALICTITANAQLLRAEQLEKYAKEKYGDNWTNAAENLSKQITLDKNNMITYSEVIDCSGQTKDQLYVKLNYWFTQTFNDANSVIKLNDKELGSIIGQGFVSGIAEQSSGFNRYSVNMRPVIKADIKDGKVRITVNVIGYYVIKESGGGLTGALMGVNKTAKEEQIWPIEKCFPFAKKDSHKKASSKALVMTSAFENTLMDMIKEAVQKGISGNENDNW